MLKAIYDDGDDIAENYRDLYEERDGKWYLTQVEGLLTENDVTKIKRALEKERSEHKKTREQMKEVAKEEDSVSVGASRNIEREMKKLQEALAESQSRIHTYEQAERSRKVQDTLREVAQEKNVRKTAIGDVLLRGERDLIIDDDGIICSNDDKRLSPKEWLDSMMDSRSHWWEDSQGGGAKETLGHGTVKDNPWKREHWDLARQTYICKEDETLADRLAKEAGVDLS